MTDGNGAHIEITEVEAMELFSEVIIDIVRRMSDEELRILRGAVAVEQEQRS